jgi:hypothetical protein
MKKIYLILLTTLFFGCNKDLVKPTEVPNKNKGAIFVLSLKIGNHNDTISVSNVYKPLITAEYSNGFTMDFTDSVTISTTDASVFLKDKKYYGSKSGTAIFNITYKNFTVKDTIYVSEIEYLPVDEKLKSSNDGVITIPVVIINYLPTNDGINLDMDRAPDGFYKYNYSTLDNVKNKILSEKFVDKYSIEEGSRFRDYAKNVTKKYVNINVIKYINIYEMNLVPWKSDGYQVRHNTIDFKSVFTKINLKELVEVYGVKEVWFTSFPKDNYPSVMADKNSSDRSLWYDFPETNMASPTSGDVSNSERNNSDLPIYNKTYVVYGCNASRGVDTDLHVRGHQLESQMSYLDKDNIWWNTFAKVGRAGNTHWCPNSTSHYDYGNKNFAKSDITTWKPSGGTYVDVNVDTWLSSKKYNFNMTVKTLTGGTYDNNMSDQVKWLIFWWQSVPGYQNNIIDGNMKMTNWWDLYYNWDDAVRSRKKLIE